MLITANSLNTSIYPNNGVSIYVSKLNGNDTTGTGGFFSPLKTMNAALTLCRGLSGTYFFINVVDAETYDEAMLLDISVNIYAPAATFSCSTATTFTLTGSGVVINASVIQSLAGDAVLNNAGYPIINFNASFAGDFVNNAGGTTSTIFANTIFGSVTNPGSSARTIINLAAAIGGSAGSGTFCPWSNTLTPAS